MKPEFAFLPTGQETEPRFTSGEFLRQAVTTARFVEGQSRSMIELADLLEARTRERDDFDRRLSELNELYARILAVAQGGKPKPSRPSLYLSPVNTAAEEMHPDVKLVFDLQQQRDWLDNQLATERTECARQIERQEKSNTELRQSLSRALTLKDRYWNALKRIRAGKKKTKAKR
jgi:hypothetical protein